MSNAMRSGKRLLASVAAGALGAGMLTVAITAPAANAATPVDISATLPGIAIIAPDDSSGIGVVQSAVLNRRQIPITIFLTDANGDLDNYTSGQALTASVITPTGAVGSTTTSFRITDDSVATNSGFAGVSLPSGDADPAGTAGVYTFNLNPNSGGSGASDVIGWNDDSTDGNGVRVPTGNYIVRVTLTNINTGSTIKSLDIPVRVLSSAARPAATFTWLSGTIGATGLTAYNTPSAVNNLGQARGGATAAQWMQMTETATGYPMVSPTRQQNAAGSVLLSGATSVDSSADTAATISTPFSNGASTVIGAAPGVYSVTPADTNWTPGAVGTIKTAFATATTASTSTLPVTFGTSTGSSNVTAVVTTTPQFRPTSGNIQLPAGTTQVTFTVSPSTLGDTITGTLPWNIAATGGGTVTPSGGIASLTNNSASITVTLSAAAAANLSNLQLTTPGLTLASSPYTVAMRSPAMTLTAPASQVAKIGDAVPVSGTLLSQFGSALTGSYLVSIARTGGSTLASATPAADGAWSLTIPAAASPTAAATVEYTLSAVSPDPTVTPVTRVLNVTYSATGAITALTVGTNPVSTVTSVPSLLTPGDGLVLLGTVSTALTNPASPGTTIPTGTEEVARITVSSTPATAITLTAPEGVYLSTAVSGNVLWNAGVKTLTVSSGTTISAWTTKAGKSDITVTAGSLTQTASVYGWVPANTARNLAITPDKAEVDRNTFTNFSLKVTDVFGNAVPGVAVSSAAAQAQGVTVNLAGGGTIPQFTTTTNATGTVSVAYTAPNASGTAQLAAAGAGAQFASTITGAPAAQATAASTITVRGETPTKSIVIVGERGTVGGKSGIIVDGSTRGFDVGSKMVPNLRFPGETSFTAGTARPTTAVGGDFTWQRKTGKQVTVFFTNEAGDIRSNRVTIKTS